MARQDDAPDTAALRRLAARLNGLPPRPWDAVERSDLQVGGPTVWDPDIQPDPAAHERDEAARAARAVWRGLVDAAGDPIVGEALPGGDAPRAVHGVWRQVAELVSDAEQAVSEARRLWQSARHQQVGAPPDEQPAAPARAGPPVAGGALQAAARAAYEAVFAPGVERWEGLPASEQALWRRRAAAALEAARRH